MVKNRAKIEYTLLVWIVLTAIWNYVSYFFDVGNLSTYSYVAVLIFWLITVQKDIYSPFIRRRLLAGGTYFIVLFCLRYIRWNIAPDFSTLERYCWYGYYFPTIMTPLLSLAISLSIGDKDIKKLNRIMFPFRIMCLFLLTLVFTNDLHEAVLHIWVEGGKEHSSPGPAYYAIMAWYFLLCLSSLIIMLYKCSISSVRKRLWFPVSVGLFGMGLCILYFVNGASSPKLFGHNLYNIQEAYMIVFLGLWESCILIGLIPSKSLIKEREWIKEGILEKVGDKIARIRELLEGMWTCDEDTFRDRLIRMCCLGAYIKRRANMELCIDENGYIDTKELTYAIRECFEYLPMYGITAGYEDTGNAKIPAAFVTTAYDILERIVERTQSACYAKVYTSENTNEIVFRSLVEADIKEEYSGGDHLKAIAEDELSRAVKMLGGSIDVHEKDDTVYFELTLKYDLRKKRIGLESDLKGLAGITRFLSIEDMSLGAKTKIHDALGRALLIAKRYLIEPGSVGRDAVLRELEYSLSLAENVSGEGIKDEHFIDRCIEQAGNLGVEVNFEGTIPEDEDIRMIVDTAITVEITNVLRYSDEKTLSVLIPDDEREYTIEIRTAGKPADSEFVEKGGLKNLRELAESVGGTMSLVFEPTFLLTVTMLKGEDR
ncbi:MAG: hypothetical protein J6X36_06230 [Lachnospiraceae bacterium]|nr:hypothetical protein [Lachnospiraceae bacterium]